MRSPLKHEELVKAQRIHDAIHSIVEAALVLPANPPRDSLLANFFTWRSALRDALIKNNEDGKKEAQAVFGAIEEGNLGARLLTDLGLGNQSLAVATKQVAKDFLELLQTKKDEKKGGFLGIGGKKLVDVNSNTLGSSINELYRQCTYINTSAATSSASAAAGEYSPSDDHNASAEVMKDKKVFPPPQLPLLLMHHHLTQHMPHLQILT